jgi:hypothetical protein
VVLEQHLFMLAQTLMVELAAQVLHQPSPDQALLMLAAVGAVMAWGERLAQVGLEAAVMLLDLAMERLELLTQAAAVEVQMLRTAATEVRALSSSKYLAPTPQLSLAA